MLSALPQKILKRISSKFVEPQSLLAEIGIGANQAILELGSPIGFFAPTAITLVGQEGKVFVAGPTNESLEALSYLQRHSAFKSILLRDILQAKTIAPCSIDYVLLTNVLSNAVHPGDYCLSIVPYLKPGGEVALIDWDVRVDGVGPDKAQRVTREQAIKLLTGCGLEFVRVLHTPGYHYAVVFRASGQADHKNGNLAL